MKLLRQYQGLRKEVYVLVFGRVISSMGALVWPLLTLILSNKLHLSASEIATYLLINNLVAIPVALISGRLADCYNKKYLILACNAVSASSFLICGFMEPSLIMVAFLLLGSIFAGAQWPAYDALLADLTKSKDRQRAYSLNYLGANLGMMLAPAIGGVLFKDYLNLVFIISALATVLASILIIFMVKNIKREKEELGNNNYEVERDDLSTFGLLSQNKILIGVIAVFAISQFIYNTYNYLIPLDLGSYYGADGASVFGLLVSLNCFLVVFVTPILTQLTSKVKDFDRLILGELSVFLAFVIFAFNFGDKLFYYTGTIVLTMGEIFSSLGRSPYITKRIPASHRGRVTSITMIVSNIASAIGLQVIGVIIDASSIRYALILVSIVSTIVLIFYGILRYFDRKKYALLYGE